VLVARVAEVLAADLLMLLEQVKLQEQMDLVVAVAVLNDLFLDLVALADLAQLL
jgi:hypothetical protein